MSIRSLLTPYISARLLSEERLLKLRARAERRRVADGAAHEVHYFHQVDDPYSALACAVLSALAARYDIVLHAHVVGPPPDGAAPERDMLIAYSRRDAQLLADHTGLDFRDPGAQPSQEALRDATSLLVAACADGRFADVAADVSRALWQHAGRLAGNASTANESRNTDDAGSANAAASLRRADAAEVARHIDAADALRRKLGHYLGATFYYAGEWYWGIDRLHYLEARLQQLGAARAGVSGALFPPAPDLTTPLPAPGAPVIDFFFSLRSPYSAIVAPRVFRLAQLTGAAVNLRFVLPMVMRGLPVPREKRSYIVHDTAREARLRGIPFGRLNDPVGRPTERGLAIIPYAERAGLGQEYVLSFMRGVWAEGIDAGSERGLRKIVERCGLRWEDACAGLRDESWRERAEQNRQAMFDLGIWGVPSLRVGDTAVWGQDRLWAITEALFKSA